MKIFNLTQYAGIKADKYIKAKCGGRYTRKEAYNAGGIGIGRLRYVSGISTIDKLESPERFRANLELFKEGLGIYVRSLSHNYLVVMPSDSITKVSLEKKEDSLRHVGFSWTEKLLNFGMPYHYARIMLLEDEIGELHDTYLSIDTLDEAMVFTTKRAKPDKIRTFFELGPYGQLFDADIKGYRYS